MTKSKQGIGSDLGRLDAHVVAPKEYDEAPELTDAFFDRATYAVNGVEQSRPRVGRPPKESPKRHVNLRLDADVVDHFKAAGPGWQTRINAALREVVGR